MDDQAFSILEYDQLRALLRLGAQTPMGRARVDALAPLNNVQTLRKALGETAECVHLRKRGVAWSFSEIADPAEAIGRLRVEGTALEPIAILGLARLCEQVLSARASILAESELAPVLSQRVASLPRELNSLAARVANKILPSGELDDRASPELARIRHEITRLRSNITRSLENLMRRSEAAVQDELVTIRNDRFVIPIKADHRGHIKGVAHGFSSSGATAFVEPLETIDANNELQGLREMEEREIHHVLLGLSDELRSQLAAIEMAAQAMEDLDFIHAKAVFHQKFDCVIPEITNGDFELIDARHPLLEENLRKSGGAVVPVSFLLDQNNNAMVISGANAGGKTVVLKTAGLLSLMALSGLPVPARAASVPFFYSVLADIGDHQSLAANLSTFTSHVANISRMLELCRSPALVLLDEVGTGTDPEEGSALGVAVVDHFRKACGAQVLATTHYSGLKMYAANEAGVINASVEFDEKTLKPTYKLITGVAGSSSGLEIAKRFGIPEMIVGAATGKVTDSSREAGEYLRRIKREAEEAAELRRALEEERAAVAEKFGSLDREAEKRERNRQAEFDRNLQRSIASFEKYTRELLAKIEDRADRLRVEREAQKRIAEVKREAKRVAQASTSSPDRGGVRVIRGGEIISHRSSSPAEPPPTSQESFAPAPPREIVPGDRVRLRSFGSVGIVDTVKGDEAEVRVKSLRLREKVENLELVQDIAPKSETGRFAKLRPSTAELQLRDAEKGTSEINVIGQRADEAVEAVDKFLDEAVMNSLGQVRVVHGYGTGALRRAVAELLTGHPHVARFSNAPQDQGGSGATVVELRQ
ncbi:MAG TPA: Smr/MutS family protein [Pyrinomonadaceae bacterium]|nr:Smr/MutS family protein [Pyrinomonadaceae bacterium]